MLYKKLKLFYVFKLYYFLQNNKDDYYFFHPHKYNLIDILKIILFNRKDVYIIQMINNKIIGYGMLRGWQDNYNIPRLGIIIDKNYRGFGYSKNLMNYLHDVCKLKGSNKVSLKVMKNNKMAIKLYEKRGYIFSEYDIENLIGEKQFN